MSQLTLEKALFLGRNGVPPIPLKYMGKTPLISWKEFQHRVPSESEIRRWFTGKKANLGVVTGAISNLVVVDSDSLRALEWGNKNLPETPMMTTTYRGQHNYFRYPSDADSIRTLAKVFNGDLKLDIDIRGDGGYAVGPSSIHEEGHVYSEIIPWEAIDFTKIPEFPTKLFSTEAKSKKDFSNLTILKPRILRSLKEFGQAIQGEGGDEKTYRVACYLTRDLGLTISEALPYMLKWNEENIPLWNESELILKLEGALKYGIGEIHRGRKLVLTSAKDLVVEPPEEYNWIWHGILPANGTSIFVSKPKVGKTTMARALAVAVASGSKFLDLETKKAPVVYIAAEENREQFKQSLAHLPPEQIQDLFVHTGMTPPNIIEALEDYLETIKPGLIILDTMIRTIQVIDTNNYAEMSKALSPFQEIATKHQCHIMMTHHAGKVEREHGDSVLGSTAIFASVDTLLCLEKKNEKIFFKTLQRYGTSLDPTLLTYDKVTRHHSLGGTANDIQNTDHESRVLNFLENFGKEATEQEIIENTTGHVKAIGSAIRRLHQNQKIKRTGDGKRNSPFKYSIIF